MARSYQLRVVKTDEVLAELPLDEAGDTSRVKNGSTSQSYSMHLNSKRVPPEWQKLIKRLETYIVVFDDALDEPLWEGIVVDINTQGGGVVGIDCKTFEWLWETDAYVPGLRFDLVDLCSGIGKGIAASYEADGLGMNVVIDAPASGQIRTKYYKATEQTTIGRALNDLGLEWNIFCRWETPEQKKLIKKAYIRYVPEIAPNPDIAFVLDGPARNIASYDYSAPANGGEVATRIKVVGAGSGDVRTESEWKIDHERELHVPKRMVYVSMPDIETTNDANIYADFIKKDYFVRRDSVTLTARANGATTFADVHDMTATARVDIYAKEVQFNAVTRIGGWSVPRDIRSFTPTLVKLTGGSLKFPKSVDPAVSTETQDIKDSLKLLAGRDPFEKGFKVPKTDGTGSWGVDPDQGFGSYDDAGNFAPSGGSGSGGGMTHSIVETGSTENTLTVGILVGSDTEAVQIENHTGRILAPGDQVDVGLVSYPNEAEPRQVVLGKGRNADGSIEVLSAAFRYRVFSGYPFSTIAVGVPMGSVYADSGNASKMGTDTIIVDAPSSNSLYNYKTGVMQGLSAPASHGFLSNAINLVDDRMYHWFLDSAGFPRLFKRSSVGWQSISGLPQNPDKFTTGVWDAASFGKEAATYPCMASIQVTERNLVAGRLQCAARIRVLDVATDQFVERLVPLSVGMKSTIYYMPDTYPQYYSAAVVDAVAPKIVVYQNANHVYLVVSASRVNGDNTSETYETREALYHYDLTTGVLDMKEEVAEGGALNAYLGMSSNSLSPRTSSDGQLYAATNGLIHARGLSDVDPRNVQFSNLDVTYFSSGVQRHRLTDRYFAIHYPENGDRLGVTEIDMGTGYYGAAVPPNSYGQEPLYGGLEFGIPQQASDGSILFHFEPVDPRYGANYRMLHRIVPDIFGPKPM